MQHSYQRMAPTQQLVQALRGGPDGVGGGSVGRSTQWAAASPQPMVRQQPTAMQTMQSTNDMYSTGRQMYDNGREIYDWTKGFGSSAPASSSAPFFNAGNSSVQGAGLAGSASSAAPAGGFMNGLQNMKGAGGAMGTGMAYLGAAKTGAGLIQGMNTKQGIEGRDKGTMGGALGSAGQGAASGAQIAGPIGALVGAAAGNESYQMQHGNRKGGPLDFHAGLGDRFKFELGGGAAGADLKNWLGF